MSDDCGVELVPENHGIGEPVKVEEAGDWYTMTNEDAYQRIELDWMQMQQLCEFYVGRQGGTIDWNVKEGST